VAHSLKVTRKREIKDREFKHGVLLIKADDGLMDLQILAPLYEDCPTVEYIRKSIGEYGPENAFNEYVATGHGNSWLAS
jgi:hypothetical protein